MKNNSNNTMVIGIGECLWDCFPTHKRLGGAPANFAYHAGQLLGMDRITIISAVGNDPLGDETLTELDKRGLKHIIPRTDYPTGKVEVTTDAAGIPTYNIFTDVAYDHICYSDEMDALARHTGAVCFGTLAQRNTASRNAITRFIDATPDSCLRIFDINLRQQFYCKEVIEPPLERCNILKLNDDELPIVCHMFGITVDGHEACCRALMSRFGIQTVIYTCGVHGSYIYTPDAMSFKATPKVEVVETVGAGDSFTAAFCSAMLMGRSLDQAHSLAVEVSAFVCTQPGAMPQLPSHLKV